MRRKRNLQQLLLDAPAIHEGVRGVSAELGALHHYIDQHALCWADRSDLTEYICRVIGSLYETHSYSPGALHRRAHYGQGLLTGRLELDAALASQPAGLRCRHGLIHTVPRRGVRDEYRYSGERWIRVRTWRLSPDGLLLTGRPKRIGRWSVQCARRAEQSGWCYTEYTGRITSTRTRRKVRQWFSAEVFVAAVAKQRQTPAHHRQTVTITLALLRRLCPPEYDVVLTPASEGEQPSPALRERITGEEYHYPPSINHRRPIGMARDAFEQRAAQREQAGLDAMVARGEADDIYVCVADSLIAGNCPHGTTTWAERHDFDTQRHYRAGELAAAGKCHRARFVRAAIVAAYRRHRREMDTGRCELAEHRA